jgi:hypothetical protein
MGRNLQRQAARYIAPGFSFPGDHVKASHSSHGVVFYPDHDGFLCDSVSDFCLRAIRAEEPLLVIATREHLRKLADRAGEAGFDWPKLRRSGAVTEYDAADVLDQFMIQGSPNQTLFDSVMERVFAPFTGLADQSTLRVFGEMVNLLCERGDAEQAITLERMWNELARRHRFMLLCAYSMGNLYREVNGSLYTRICETHDHVLEGDAA